MKIERFPIKQQDFDKVVHMDQSANHWSQEHTRLMSASMDALQTYRDLVAGKNQAVSDLVKAGGLKELGRVVQARLVKNDKGEAFVEVMMHDEAPEAPAPEQAAHPAEPAAPAS